MKANMNEVVLVINYLFGEGHAMVNEHGAIDFTGVNEHDSVVNFRISYSHMSGRVYVTQSNLYSGLDLPGRKSFVEHKSLLDYIHEVGKQSGLPALTGDNHVNEIVEAVSQLDISDVVGY